MCIRGCVYAGADVVSILMGGGITERASVDEAYVDVTVGNTTTQHNTTQHNTTQSEAKTLVLSGGGRLVSSNLDDLSRLKTALESRLKTRIQVDEPFLQVELRAYWLCSLCCVVLSFVGWLAGWLGSSSGGGDETAASGACGRGRGVTHAAGDGGGVLLPSLTSHHMSIYYDRRSKKNNRGNDYRCANCR
jgi:hypothetical protein